MRWSKKNNNYENFLQEYPNTAIASILNLVKNGLFTEYFVFYFQFIFCEAALMYIDEA